MRPRLYVIGLFQKINSSTCNYHPDVPIPQGGIFYSIKNPFIVAERIFSPWFDFYGRNDFLAIITLLWLFVMPAMETIAADNWAWIAHKFTAHPILMLVCSGPFHPYLLTFAKQGIKPKFDPKPMRKRLQFALGD